MKNDIITLEITDITPEGFGVGRYEGKVVFVADTAIGDKISALVLKELKNHSFAKAQSIITPSADRIESDCAVSKKCGGCNFRHISYDAEAKLKKSFVAQAFSRIGNMDVKVNDTVVGDPYRYRNKVQYPFGNQSGNCIFGYYAKRSHRIVTHETCPLQEQIFTDIANFCSAEADKLFLHPYNEESGKGLLRHIVMRKNRKGDILVCLVATQNNRKFLALAEQLTAQFPEITGVHLNLNKRRDNVIFGDETVCLLGDETLKDSLCGKIFELSPRAFYQVNAEMAERLYSHAKSLIMPEQKSRIVLDLYCGAGTIGICLANDDDKLCGVEIIDAAIDNARINARLNGRNDENTLFICGDAQIGVEECRKKFGNPEIIIVDPPRKGLDKSVIETVISAQPKQIIYISCDPATLARDCAIFAQSGYIAKEATPFDLFPRTGHVETVVLLSR